MEESKDVPPVIDRFKLVYSFLDLFLSFALLSSIYTFPHSKTGVMLKLTYVIISSSYSF